MKNRTHKRAHQSTMRELADSSLERAERRAARKAKRRDKIMERREGSERGEAETDWEGA